MINIKNISKFKVESSILIPIILFFIISIISIYSTKNLLSIEYQNLWLKHPLQDNLYHLPLKEKFEIVKDL